MNIKYIKEIIKLHIADPKYIQLKNRIKDHSNSTFYIIGGPVHGNLGDHAIMEEEKCFVKDFFPEYDCEEILMPFFNTQKTILKDYIHEKDIVCVSGGGWMGDLWFHNEATIRDIIRMFPNNKIVIFPQTLYYSDSDEGNKVLRDTIDCLSKHNDLLICVRDMKSLHLIKERFILSGKSDYYYCPDMVLYGGTVKPIVDVAAQIG